MKLKIRWRSNSNLVCCTTNWRSTNEDCDYLSSCRSQKIEGFGVTIKKYWSPLWLPQLGKAPPVVDSLNLEISICSNTKLPFKSPPGFSSLVHTIFLPTTYKYSSLAAFLMIEKHHVILKELQTGMDTLHKVAQVTK